MYKEKASIHGAVISIASFVFFPVAFILLLLRLILHSNMSYMRPRDYKVAALTFVGTLVFINVILLNTSGTGQGTAAAVMLVLFAFPIAILLVLARGSRRKLERQLERYRQLVIDQGVSGVGYIAQSAGVSERKALNDLNFMVRAGLLPFTYIDQDNRQVIVQRVQEPWGNPPVPPAPQNGQWGGQPMPPMPGGEQGAPANPAPRSPVSVNCTGCGAESTILPGETRHCEFCGNVLPRSG
ncbi:hypothetical protein [Paenibacillus nasutitermitis]|uniref:Uncharacterized protein n=1 Tax=Paenibacillus nasutitermitis TaxID=1652958 RepID=A0A916ZEM7_9BACL|nr:hypothetical protein [Paenibacillus nasutitermitis]GGD90140.1 hypothetical protein GCM10010911_55980 [Paenibacillus nasutitermitis]